MKSPKVLLPIGVLATIILGCWNTSIVDSSIQPALSKTQIEKSAPSNSQADSTSSASYSAPPLDPVQRKKAIESFGKVPLSFEPPASLSARSITALSPLCTCWVNEKPSQV